MRDRIINALVWFGIFCSGCGIASIVVATRVHGEIIKPFGIEPIEPLPVCWTLQDSFDISVGVTTRVNAWPTKVAEGKCAIITLPWFYYRTVFKNGDWHIAEVRVKSGEWHTMYAVFNTLPRTVEA